MSVRLFNDNFLDLNVISQYTFSSEQTNFPVDNVFNLQRRSKVWRTNGYFEITSSNNEIIFRETTAVDLTATVAVGNYSSSTALFAAIKTALEAVGGSTYTVESDATTLKTKFTSNGVGGGGIFEIDWINSSMASVLGFNTIEEDTGLLTYTADTLKIHTDEWIKFDFGISTLPTAFALIGPRNSPLKITPSATFQLQGNETDNWSSPTASATLTYDDEVIFLTSTTGLWSEALRYARLRVIDTSNPNGFIEIGALYLGGFFESTRGQVQFPFVGNYIDRSSTVTSEGGQTFSDIRQKTESFKIEWYGLTIAEKETIDDFFADFGTSSPFFVQFDSEDNLAFSSRNEKYVRFVKFESSPSYRLESPGLFSCTMDLIEEL